MRVWIVFHILLLASATANAADVCPGLDRTAGGTEAATRIAAYACHEHGLWYRPFIDRNGRSASITVMESEAAPLDDGQSQAGVA